MARYKRRIQTPPHICLRNGRFDYRRAVPEEIREALGQREIVRALGTDLREAEGLVRRLDARVDMLFQATRERPGMDHSKKIAEVVDGLAR